MKITPEHYEHMRNAIGALPIDAVRAHKLTVTDKRFRWDLAHAAGLTPWICGNIYQYANDSHIDTALRAIVRDMGI